MSDGALSGGRDEPRTKEDLMRCGLRELRALARECRVVYTGVNKADLAARVAEYLSHPFTHRRTIVATR